MATNRLMIEIGAKDMASKVFRSVKESVSSFAKSAVGQLAGMVSVSYALAKVGQTLGDSLRTAFKFEAMTLQFKSLLGSMDKAKARIKDLAQFASETPFELPEIIKANRVLEVMSGGILSTIKYMTLFGDATMAVGATLDDTAMWFGRLYDAIKNGKPFGEAAMRLGELGLMSGSTRSQMEAMQKSGASNLEVWNVFEKSISKFAGGMKDAATTGEGLASTLKDSVNLALKEVGDSAMGAAKGGMASLTKSLDDLRNSGAIKTWSERTVSYLGLVTKAYAAYAEMKYKQSMFPVMGQIYRGGVEMMHRLRGVDPEEAARQKAMAAETEAQYAAVDEANKANKLKDDMAKGTKVATDEEWQKKSETAAMKQLEGELDYLSKSAMEDDKILREKEKAARIEKVKTDAKEASSKVEKTAAQQAAIYEEQIARQKKDEADAEATAAQSREAAAAMSGKRISDWLIEQEANRNDQKAGDKADAKANKNIGRLREALKRNGVLGAHDMQKLADADKQAQALLDAQNQAIWDANALEDAQIAVEKSQRELFLVNKDMRDSLLIIETALTQNLKDDGG